MLFGGQLINDFGKLAYLFLHFRVAVFVTIQQRPQQFDFPILFL
jgi:hypothetical protein